jgi:hypothetical protein
MSSWFNADAIKGLTEKVQSVKDQVQSAIPIETIEKLTLTTPELTAERRKIDQEERRKEQVRDMLAGMMPWETRDPERDILVEECKEAILKLSSNKDVFFGPYSMPKAGVTIEEEAEDEDKDAKQPSNETRERLKTLEPLPPLLHDFDLDAHVGLINKLLKADPKLVKMQSSLSGGGEHEKVFWHNYFFHCAWCRYEAGLSIDEIWSDQPEEKRVEAAAAAAAENENEEEITFEEESEKAFASDPVTEADAPFRKEESKETNAAATAGVTSTNSSGGKEDFELVEEGEDVGGVDEDVDYELDELEAEIARELED